MTQEQKIDKIFEHVTEIKVTLAETVAYQKGHAEKIKDHADKHKAIDGKLQSLTDYKNQMVGKASILSVVFGALGAGVTFLIKYMTSPHE